MPKDGNFLLFFPAREVRPRVRSFSQHSWGRRIVALLFVLLVGAVVSFIVVDRSRFFFSGRDGLIADIFGGNGLSAAIVVSVVYLFCCFRWKRVVLKCSGLKSVLLRALLCVARFLGKVAIVVVVVSVTRVLYIGMYTPLFLRDHGVCIVGDGQDDYYTFSAVRCASREHLELLFTARSSELDTDPPARITYVRMSDGRMKIHIRVFYEEGVYSTWVFDPLSGKLSHAGGGAGF